jgi:hypothetical protein
LLFSFTKQQGRSYILLQQWWLRLTPLPHIWWAALELYRQTSSCWLRPPTRREIVCKQNKNRHIKTWLQFYIIAVVQPIIHHPTHSIGLLHMYLGHNSSYKPGSYFSFLTHIFHTWRFSLFPPSIRMSSASWRSFWISCKIEDSNDTNPQWDWGGSKNFDCIEGLLYSHLMIKRALGAKQGYQEHI